MGRPIEIRLDFDASGAESGAKQASAGIDKIADATDDLAKASGKAEGSLEDLGRSGKDAADDIKGALRQAADKFRDLEREAKDTASDTETYWRDAADEIERQLEAFSKTGESEFDKVGDAAKDAATDLDRDLTQALDGLGDKAKAEGDKVDRGLRDGFDGASEGAAEMRDNVQQEATEMASSFDGSVDSIKDSAQTIIAEAFAGFGPAGAAAGIAAGIGIGIIGSYFERAKERAQEVAEEVAEISGQLIELGASKRGPEQVDEALKDAASTAEDGSTVLMAWAESAEKAGVNTTDFLRGMAGDGEAAARVLADLKAADEAYMSGQDAARAKGVQDANAYINAHKDEVAARKDATDALSEANGILDESTVNYGLYTDSVEDSVAAVVAENEAIEANNALKAEQAEGAASAFLAEGEYAKSVREASAAIAENGLTTDALTEAGQANREALVDLASASTDYATTAAETGKTQEEVNGILQRGRTDFLNAAAAAGMGADEANALADSLGLVPDNVTPTVKVDGAAQAQTDAQNTKTELEKIDSKVYTADVEVKVKPLGSLLQDAVNAAARSLVPPSVAVNPTLGMRRTA